MPKKVKRIQNTYLALMLFSTLSASLIWGINTLFLLDAGLSNTEAFAANAFFTLGMVLFEIPTGVVADSRGRQVSYLLGAFTLMISTLLYLLMWQIHAPFWGWALSSVFIGLGFTFFSGATEAWLVDALKSANFKGPLETVFAKGQIATGIAMLTGSFLGGLIAQFSSLGVPYVLRAVFLAITFVIAFIFMKDMGFTPAKGRSAAGDIKKLLDASLDQGLRNPSVRWIMLAAPFTTGVMIYVFYAMQPYLLQLWGDPQAYVIAGLAASIVAGAQIVGGLTVKYFRKLFKTRTGLLFVFTALGAALLLALGLVHNFWLAIVLLMVWALLSAASMPVRQAYLNGVIPTNQRATVLSFDSLMGSSGGAVFQPVLGKAADVWSYSASYLVSSAIAALAIPFMALARKQHHPADNMQG